MWAQLTKTLGQVASVGSVSLAVDNTQLELPGGVTSVESAADLGYDVAATAVFDTALLRNGDAIRRFDPRYVPDTQASKRPDLKPKDGDIARVPDTWGSLALSVDGKQVAAVSADRRDLSIWRATEPTRSVASFATSLTQPTLRRQRLPLDRRHRRPGQRPRLRPRLRLERPEVRAEADQDTVAAATAASRRSPSRRTPPACSS